MTTDGPDFLGIGSPRCGTTTLYECLRQHPDVWLPPIKELDYWGIERGSERPTRGRAARLRFGISRARRSTGRRRRDDLRFLRRFAVGRRSDRWYASLFPQTDLVTGEISPAYCTLPDATMRDMHEQFPRLKHVLMFRDPIERLWSAAAKVLARQRGRTIDQVPDEELSAFFAQPLVRARTDYDAILERWRSVYPTDAIFVGFVEDMTDDAPKFFRSLGAHLGIEPAPLVELARAEQPRNTTSSVRSQVPSAWERRLAEDYIGVTEALADEFGGPPLEWYRRAEKAIGRVEP